jgi:hypothetical protein
LYSSMKTINTSQNLVIPNKWDGKDLKSQELLENLNSVSTEQISTISEEINEKKSIEKKNEEKGKRDGKKLKIAWKLMR